MSFAEPFFFGQTFVKACPFIGCFCIGMCYFGVLLGVFRLEEKAEVFEDRTCDFWWVEKFGGCF
jgi:hypothetical protein